MRFPSGLECWLAAGKSQVMAGGTPGRGRALPVVIVDRTVTLTLADAVVHGQPVTVSFTALGGNPIRDAVIQRGSRARDFDGCGAQRGRCGLGDLEGGGVTPQSPMERTNSAGRLPITTVIASNSAPWEPGSRLWWMDGPVPGRRSRRGEARLRRDPSAADEQSSTAWPVLTRATHCIALSESPRSPIPSRAAPRPNA